MTLEGRHKGTERNSSVPEIHGITVLQTPYFQVNQGDSSRLQTGTLVPIEHYHRYPRGNGGLFEDTVLCCIHAKHVTIMLKDMQLA